jgi:hypothetical protein
VQMRFVPSKMLRTRLSWLVIGGVAVTLVAAAVDAIRSSEPLASSPSREGRRSDQRERRRLSRCLAAPQNLALSIDVLGGTASVAVRHVWGRPCQLAPLPVRLSVTNRFGGRVRLATVGGGPDVQSRAGGDFSPGFERLIDIPYLADLPLTDCNSRGPFTPFVIVGPYSAQRKLSGSEVGC